MLLSIRSLSKSFPGTKALQGVDFDLAAGEVHALLGENGAGKSTLIKCLTGAYRRDEGEILLDGMAVAPASTAEAQALGIGTVYQEVNLLPNMTVAQNLTFGREPRRFGLVDGRAQSRMAREMLAPYGLDIDVERDLGSYSVALQQIVAIARAVALSGKVLILDEPTASLDAAEVGMLFGIIRRLREQGLGIVFVSHFLDQVFDLSDRVTVLRNGRKIVTERTADLDRLRLISHMLGREFAEVLRRADGGEVLPDRAEMLRFEKLGRPGLVEAFDLSVGEGEVIGLAGLLGSGRTESAELLFGVRSATSGTGQATRSGAGRSGTAIRARRSRPASASRRKTARLTGSSPHCRSARTSFWRSRRVAAGRRPVARAEQERLAAHYIQRLDIRTSNAEKPVGQLSGGNQQKVVLARWLAMNPRFLILDEPTRGIDVGAHAEIMRLIHEITQEGMAVLVISSELDELVAVCDRVVVVRDRRHVAELSGGAISERGHRARYRPAGCRSAVRPRDGGSAEA
jgi:monosaccharide-transporting ATPase